MNLRHAVFSFAAATLLSVGFGTAALAETATVTQRVTPGQLTAYVDGGAINVATYSHGSQDTSWTLTLHVDDSRGTYEGWRVTIASSDFVYEGGVAGDHTIPADHFLLGATGTPEWVAGQAIDAGIAGSVTNGPLGSGQTPLTAQAGHGSGTYTQTLPVTLMVPDGSPAGQYVATLTVHTSSAPN